MLQQFKCTLFRQPIMYIDFNENLTIDLLLVGSRQQPHIFIHIFVWFCLPIYNNESIFDIRWFSRHQKPWEVVLFNMLTKAGPLGNVFCFCNVNQLLDGNQLLDVTIQLVDGTLEKETLFFQNHFCRLHLLSFERCSYPGAFFDGFSCWNR